MNFDYQEFYNEAPFGYFTSNEDGIIINANQFFLKMLKCGTDEVIGKMGLQDFLPMGGKMYFQTHYFPILQIEGKIKEVNFEILTKDKIRIQILINTVKSLSPDGSVFYHSVVVDFFQRSLFEKELIAERKNAEQLTEQLKRTNEDIRSQEELIRRQNKSLERLNTVKDKFFSIVAHDIKAPLSNLYSFVSVITDHMDALSKEEIQDMSHDLKKSISSTIDMATNLIDWAQSQMNSYHLSKSSILLEDVVKEVIKSNFLFAEKKSVILSYEVKNNLKVKVDENQLLFILRNLLTNAIKFTPTGGFVKIQCFENIENKIEISVKDSGVGMSEELLNSILSDTKKNTRNGTEGEQGNGIGLLLVKEFVTLNKGSIEVFSKENEGTEVILTLDADN